MLVKISNSSKRWLLLFFVFLIGTFSGFSQKAPAEYSRLSNLNTTDLTKWVQLQPKLKLAKVCDYFLTETEKLLRKKDFKKAKFTVGLGLVAADKLEDPFIFGKFYYFLGNTILELQGSNGYESALEILKKSETYLTKISDKQSKLLLGKVCAEIAVNKIKSKKNEEDFAIALSYIKTIYSLAKETNSEHLIGLTYSSLGLYFFYHADYLKSLTYYEAGEELLIRAQDYNTLLEIKTFIIRVFSKLSIRSQKIESEQKSTHLLEFTSSPNREISYLSAKASVYNSSGDYIEAIKLLRLGQEKASAMGDTKRTSDFFYSIGKTYLWEGFYSNAENELRKVILYSKEHTKSFVLNCLSGLASSLEKQGKIKEARQVFDEIRQIIGAANSLAKLNYYREYADFLASQNQIEEAKQYLELAEKEAITFKDKEILQHILSLKVWFDYKSKAISPNEALLKLDGLIAKIKEDQLSSQSTVLNINYLDEYIYPFRLKTLIQVENGDFEDALLHTDSYKSRWLINNISASGSFGIVKKDWIVSDEAKELRKEILKRLVASVLEGSKTFDIELQNLLKTHEEKLNVKRDVSTLTGKIDKTELSQNDLQELSGKLSQTVILSYSFTTEGLVAFIVKRGQPVKSVKIDVSERLLKQKIDKWRGEIVSQNLNFKQGSRELYDLLIKQVEPEIEGASELIIIPEGVLWKLPFQALLDSKGKYLIQNIPINYIPSLKALQTLQNRNVSTAISRVVGFGNPINSLVTSLPESEKEVKNLSLNYPLSSSQIRENATETSLKDEMGKADILHLAVHGKLNEAEPMRSALILTKDEKNDGNFEVEEIIELKKSPKLVILSACSTSNGQAFSGEGLLSLSWSFLVAGSQSVIGTQWDIDDRTTTEQMQLFHQQFSKGTRSAKALQYAAIKQIEKKGLQNQPFYWAGFVTVGAL